MQLASAPSARAATCRPQQAGRRPVRVQAAFKPESVMMAAVTAGSLLATPAFAAGLPEGYSSPQGSSTAAIEQQLDALIEQRTGKDLSLTPPAVEAVKEAPPPKEAAPVVVAAPMAPAVAEPPARRVTEAPAAAPAKTGLQTRSEGAGSSGAASTGPSSGLLIGGSVATLGVVAAAALAGNKGSEGDAATAGAMGATAAAAPPAGPDTSAVAPAAVEAGVSGGGAESANPSSKAE